jgi:hypothetical protein
MNVATLALSAPFYSMPWRCMSAESIDGSACLERYAGTGLFSVLFARDLDAINAVGECSATQPATLDAKTMPTGCEARRCARTGCPSGCVGFGSCAIGRFGAANSAPWMSLKGRFRLQALPRRAPGLTPQLTASTGGDAADHVAAR